MKVYDNYSEFPDAAWRWPNFTPQEMACKGTDKLAIDTRSMDMLQSLRTLLGKPMSLNSAYRSPEHNAAVGGASGSYHMKAQAFDVLMRGHDPGDFIAKAKSVGFMGIGEYADKGFTHIDSRSTPAHFGTLDWPKPPVDYEITMTDPRKARNSTTLAASGAAAAASVGTVATGVSALEGNAQTIIVVAGVVVLLAAAWIARERIKRGLRDGWG